MLCRITTLWRMKMAIKAKRQVLNAKYHLGTSLSSGSGHRVDRRNLIRHWAWMTQGQRQEAEATQIARIAIFTEQLRGKPSKSLTLEIANETFNNSFLKRHLSFLLKVARSSDHRLVQTFSSSRTIKERSQTNQE